MDTISACGQSNIGRAIDEKAGGATGNRANDAQHGPRQLYLIAGGQVFLPQLDERHSIRCPDFGKFEQPLARYCFVLRVQATICNGVEHIVDAIVDGERREERVSLSSHSSETGA